MSTSRHRSHLDELEAEAVHIMREVAAELERPVLLFSGGKDSIVLLRLAEKAFRPGRFPFPLMHVDTGHNFPEVIEYRDRRVAELGERLVVASVQESIDRGRVVEQTGPRASRNQLQTTTLLDAMEANQFDAAIGGARRDEERSRAKERIFSFRDDFGQWDPRAQRPELWSLYNGKIRKGEQVRVFPISNWTELDVWQYVARESLELPSIYYAHEREVFERDGMLYATSDVIERADDEIPFQEWVRFRTVGDMSCTGAVRSHATSFDDVVAEIAATRVTERGRDPRRRSRLRGSDGGPETCRILLRLSFRQAGIRGSGFPRRSSRLSRGQIPEGAASRPCTRCLLTSARTAATGDLLRLVTCGSVDDGKSTLIGRLLFDTKQVFVDQMEAVEETSERRGDGYVNLALLTDGLRAEREQGITIDVAYRGFVTERRRFQLADAPGHVQYTRNMVTGASTADVAVVLVDARKGVIEQTRRHTLIASLLAVPHLVFAVNKMDLVDYDEERFNEIARELDELTGMLGVKDEVAIPIAALHGDNVVDASERMPWWQGGTLLHHLEEIELSGDRNLVDRRFPVQWVIRPMAEEFHDYRGYAGQVAGGVWRAGDDVLVLPSGLTTRVASVETSDGPMDEATPGMSVTIRLENEIDVPRGDMLVDPDDQPITARALEATICWMSERPMTPGARFGVKHTTRVVRAVVEGIDGVVDMDTLEYRDATEMALNDIGTVRLRLSGPLMVDAYAENRATGAFILVDEATNDTVAAGMVRSAST